ncbi:putative disease resistance protein At3g14460 [Pyrus x bretschneideri]|uniref:putative disease resistance protein At3g14460 n=1 Tax=Pyrus x bretschneideri TaxID=225117 RepID=UPI00202DF493|nr:putative disease resistance protein At3g14460 [Pyrus x bretschneideri]
MPNWIGNLKHLRYIDLSYGGVEKLPETICTLHNLQTLLLSNCYALAQFPINLARLINLHHLDVRSTKVKEMPPHMDMLKDLHTLSDFVVGKQTASDIKELKELQIAGTLSISGLHNIVNSVDAFEANMRDKHLNELALTWGSDTDDLQKDIEVLSFVIKSSCDSTKSIPLDYFPRVKELKLYDCLNLESLTYSHVSDSPTFLFLGILKIHKCPNFVSFPKGGLYAPNLIELIIYECNKLRSLPEHMCTRLSSLRAVTLNYYPELESFPEGGLPPNLDMLRIFGCKKLIANRMHWGLDRLISLICFGISFEECEDVVPFPEDSLLPTVLTTLYINNSPNLEILDS